MKKGTGKKERNCSCHSMRLPEILLLLHTHKYTHTGTLGQRHTLGAVQLCPAHANATCTKLPSSLSFSLFLSLARFALALSPFSVTHSLSLPPPPLNHSARLLCPRGWPAASVRHDEAEQRPLMPPPHCLPSQPPLSLVAWSVQPRLSSQLCFNLHPHRRSNHSACNEPPPAHQLPPVPASLAFFRVTQNFGELSRTGVQQRVHEQARKAGRQGSESGQKQLLALSLHNVVAACPRSRYPCHDVVVALVILAATLSPWLVWLSLSFCLCLCLTHSVRLLKQSIYFRFHF